MGEARTWERFTLAAGYAVAGRLGGLAGRLAALGTVSDGADDGIASTSIRTGVARGASPVTSTACRAAETVTHGVATCPSAASGSTSAAIMPATETGYPSRRDRRGEGASGRPGTKPSGGVVSMARGLVEWPTSPIPIAVPRAQASSRALWKRMSMSRDTARTHHPSTPGGRSRTISLGTGSVSAVIPAKSSDVVAAWKGSRPVRHSNAMTPRAQRSAR